MLTAAIKIAIVTLLSALVVLVGFTCIWMETLNRTTAEMPIVLDQAIAREGALTRAVAGKQITTMGSKLDHQGTALHTDLFARVDTIEADAFKQIDQVRIDANQQITDSRADQPEGMPLTDRLDGLLSRPSVTRRQDVVHGRRARPSGPAGSAVAPQTQT